MFISLHKFEVQEVEENSAGTSMLHYRYQWFLRKVFTQSFIKLFII